MPGWIISERELVPSPGSSSHAKLDGYFGVLRFPAKVEMVNEQATVSYCCLLSSLITTTTLVSALRENVSRS